MVVEKMVFNESTISDIVIYNNNVKIEKHHMATLFPIPNDFNTQRSELWLEAASQPNPRVEAASPPDN